MSHILLTINAGSSSLKMSAFLLKGSAEAPQKIAAACIRGINTATTTVYYARYHETVSNDITFRPKLDWCEALSSMLAILLQDPELREVHSTDDIRFVCHRIVHGKGFREPQLIDQKLFDALAEATHLAPLHSWVALTIVALCKQQFQNAANIACFDTQFHVTIPKHIYTYPIDQDVAQQHGLRKYGFHGLSYSYLARSVCKFLGTDQAATNLIALHLGSGASVCAIQNGKSLDTSMGLTPLSGLFGATRSGTIDPSLVFHCSRPASASLESPAAPDRAGARCFRWPSWERMLNAESGWCSLTDTTDFAIIAASSHSNCKLAFDMFVNRICGYIGSYYVALQGRVDALVFAGGIGEKCPQLRAAVVEQLAFLGFAVDEKCNLHIVNSGGRLIDPVRDIGVEGQKHRVLVCQTDEETEMSHICVDMGLY